MQDRSFPFSRRQALTQLGGLMMGVSAISSVGCSKLLLGTNKILFGDPKAASEFTKLTQDSLTKGNKTILVVCSAPESIESEASTLKLDLIAGITRRMKLNGVKTISPVQVAEWIDEHGSIGSDPQELAKDFETDYIAWIDVQGFDIREPNSPKLLRGRTSGVIRVYRVEEVGDQRQALTAYKTEFQLTYPEHQPLSEQGQSVIVFQQKYINHLCDLLAERFYDHRPGLHY